MQTEPTPPIDTDAPAKLPPTERHGALLIDKPMGITSAGVLRALKRRAIKLGHAGTLDPNATGLLVVLINKATRLQSIVTGAEKVYEGTIQLGVRTETDDIWGAVVESSTQTAIFENDQQKGAVLSALRTEFSGDQQQTPPQVSAVKVQGVRSYRRVREGTGAELASRDVQIEFLALEFSGPLELAYRVRCSKGTYVRGLARDIGEFLEVGGCVSSIRRLQSGPFAIADAHSIETVKEASIDELLIPMEQLVDALPRFDVTEAEMIRLSKGQQEPLARLAPPQSAAQAALISQGGQFLGLVEAPAGGEWRIGFLV